MSADDRSSTEATAAGARPLVVFARRAVNQRLLLNEADVLG
jgi:hypothetical protein